MERSHASRSVRHGAATTCCTPAASNRSARADLVRVHALRVPAGAQRDRERRAPGGPGAAGAIGADDGVGLEADELEAVALRAPGGNAASPPAADPDRIGCAGLGSTRRSSSRSARRRNVAGRWSSSRGSSSRISSVRRPRSWNVLAEGASNSASLQPDARRRAQPAAAQRVEAGEGVGQPERVVLRDDEHAGAEPDALGGRRRPREREQRVVGAEPPAEEARRRPRAAAAGAPPATTAADCSRRR